MISTVEKTEDKTDAKGSAGMNAENYRSINETFSESRIRSNTIKALHDVLPLIMYIFYPVQLICLGINEGWGSDVFLRFTLIPLGTFVFVTILRAIINAPRPYEVYDYTPVVRKQTKGKSFPSRHTASAFIIAMAFLSVNFSIGFIMMGVALGIAIIRIVAGVHFVRDVVAGAAMSLLIGVLGFFVF